MELSIPANEINTRNVYFGEKRKNVIVDGNFVKIIYSTDFFEMNGIYIFTEFESMNQGKPYESIFAEERGLGLHPFAFPNVVEPANERFATSDKNGEWVKIVNKNSIVPPKRNIVFNVSTKSNAGLIERLCRIESEIVDRYISSNCPSKNASYILKTQLLSGIIKYHSENVIIETPSCIAETLDSKNGESTVKEKCILKISGIWETATQVGITMKFIIVY